MSIDSFERGIEEARARNGYEDMDEPVREPGPVAPTKMRGPAGPPRTEKWTVLPAPYGDTDPPHRIKTWVNYPNKLSDDLASGDDDLIYAAWAQIVVEHNNWCDENGDPLPQLKRGDEETIRKFWGMISNECAQIISVIAFQAAGKASASLLNREQRRRGR